jgi:4'-phosphopantetheinyl transferase
VLLFGCVEIALSLEQGWRLIVTTSRENHCLGAKYGNLLQTAESEERFLVSRQTSRSISSPPINLLPTIVVQIHCALVDAQLPNLYPGLLARLDADEQERTLRFVYQRDRHVRALAHALLAIALQSNGIADPRFRRGAFGKPELVPADDEPRLRFNLTHTDGLVACAISRDHDVGLDAEALDRRIDYAAIARDHFAVSEQAALQRAPDKAETFMAFWTLKEAVAKSVGIGLAMPLAELEFTLDPLSVRATTRHGAAAADCHLARYSPTPRHHLALAVRRTFGAAVQSELFVVDPAGLVSGSLISPSHRHCGSVAYWLHGLSKQDNSRPALDGTYD